MTDLTLLVDEKGRVSKRYDTDHWLLPLSRRVYILIDSEMRVRYWKDMGFGLLENQTETLIQEIERHLM